MPWYPLPLLADISGLVIFRANRNCPMALRGHGWVVWGRIRKGRVGGRVHLAQGSSERCPTLESGLPCKRARSRAHPV